MKNKITILLFFSLVFCPISFAQTTVKGNLMTTLLGIPNFGVETRIGKKFTFQIDVTASFWKSFLNGPQEFVMVFPEVRYYSNKINDGFFVGVHIGGSSYKLQKWNYINTDLYQKGYNVMYGFTVGYQFVLNKKFNLELFLGGGSQQGYYNGYLLSTGERYEFADAYNKSGEFLPYRGGLMLVYKLK
jgi:Protein of unknown function (DUF3575)